MFERGSMYFYLGKSQPNAVAKVSQFIQGNLRFICRRVPVVAAGQNVCTYQRVRLDLLPKPLIY
jgi:hypothetical protein